MTTGTFDDDLNPYPIPAEKPVRRCVGCQTVIEDDTEVCPRCTVNQETGEKVERVFEPVHREWESGWPFQWRVTLFFVLQIVNVVALLILWASTKEFPFFFGLLNVGLQAFLVGSYDRLTLTRDRKGRVRLTRTWRIAFYPLKPQTIRWKEYDDLLVSRFRDITILDWVMLLILLVHFIVPAILWWWYVIRPDRTFVAMCRDHGFPDEYLYRGLNEDQARDIAESLSDLTGLPQRVNL